MNTQEALEGLRSALTTHGRLPNDLERELISKCLIALEENGDSHKGLEYAISHLGSHVFQAAVFLQWARGLDHSGKKHTGAFTMFSDIQADALLDYLNNIKPTDLLPCKACNPSGVILPDDIKPRCIYCASQGWVFPAPTGGVWQVTPEQLEERARLSDAPDEVWEVHPGGGLASNAPRDSWIHAMPEQGVPSRSMQRMGYSEVYPHALANYEEGDLQRGVDRMQQAWLRQHPEAEAEMQRFTTFQNIMAVSGEEDRAQRPQRLVDAIEAGPLDIEYVQRFLHGYGSVLAIDADGDWSFVDVEQEKEEETQGGDSLVLPSTRRVRLAQGSPFASVGAWAELHQQDGETRATIIEHTTGRDDRFLWLVDETEHEMDAQAATFWVTVRRNPDDPRTAPMWGHR